MSSYPHEIFVKHSITNREYAKLWMVQHGRSYGLPRDANELFDAAYAVLWAMGDMWTDTFADRFFVDGEESEDKDIYDALVKKVDEVIKAREALNRI